MEKPDDIPGSCTEVVAGCVCCGGDGCRGCTGDLVVMVGGGRGRSLWLR